MSPRSRPSLTIRTTVFASDHLVRVGVHELGQALADPRPARPVGHAGRHALERRSDLAGREPGRQPRERGVEGEDLGRSRGFLQRQEEAEEEARVRVHRAARVAQDDEARLFDGPCAAGEPEELAVGRQRPAEAPPRVDRAPRARRDEPPASPRGEPERRAGEQPLHGREVAGCAFVEGLPSQEGLGAVTGHVRAGAARLRVGLARAGLRSAAEPSKRAGAVRRSPRRRVYRSGRGLPVSPEEIEQRVEGPGVSPADLQGDRKRPADLLAVGQVHERQRRGRVHLVGQARGNSALPQRSRRTRAR